MSRQIDIVIYRKQRAPVLDIGGVRHFIVESVAAVVEVKAAVHSQGLMTIALENIASVKALDRTNGGHNHVHGALGLQIDTAAFQHQVFGAVATGRSMTYETCLDALLDWIGNHPRHLWPNAYVDIKEFVISYASGIVGDASPTHHSADPMTAQALAGVQPWDHPWGTESPLAIFAVELLNFLRVTPLIDYSAYGYFDQHSGYFTSARLPMPRYYKFESDFGVEPPVG